ncbi:MAG: hypothetical protein F4213_13285 [Boseongicola sp. SB0677_bin_26]|nr:hypothetical protein [Boseongicola sp. SB0677_bin_26]
MARALNPFLGAPRRLPRRNRRGLGLFDAMLAIIVLSLLALWGGQVAGGWIAGRVVTGEVRTVAELARAGRLLVEGDVSHGGRTHAVGAAPLAVGLADLEAADLRSPALGTRSPGRRALTLWLWRPNAGALVVIARARGERPLARLPGAEDGATGVGALLGTDARLRGPGLDFDMGPVNALVAGFATENDVFALDHVALDVTCRSYLFRVEVDCDGDGTPDVIANTMGTGLDMGGQDLTGAGNVTAATAAIGTLEGVTEFTGALAVGGELAVTGRTTMEDVTVSGALNAASAEVAGTLTVPDLVATGALTGADLALDGTVAVSGEARLGDADVNTLNVVTLNVEQLSSDTGTFGSLFAERATFTSCSGCGP